MAQEFFIKDANLEAKVRELLPSQGGLGAGVDLSASTQIVPIVDLTESAEGSNLRQDLQRAYGINTETFDVTNATTTIITTTGYFRCFGIYRTKSTANTRGKIQITDGVTTKDIFNPVTTVDGTIFPYDITMFVSAGQSIQVFCDTNANINGSIRQIADIDGNLVDP